MIRRFPSVASTLLRQRNSLYRCGKRYNGHDLISQQRIEEQYTSRVLRYRGHINITFQSLLLDQKYNEQVEKAMLDKESWRSYVQEYRRKLLKNPLQVFNNDEKKLSTFIERLQENFRDIKPSNDITSENTTAPIDAQKAYSAIKPIIFEIVLKKALEEMQPIVESNQLLARISDMRLPHEWYPLARLMKRKIIYHGGPTNSGKVRSTTSIICVMHELCTHL